MKKRRKKKVKKKKKKCLSSYVGGLGLILRIYVAIVEPALTKHKAIICWISVLLTYVLNARLLKKLVDVYNLRINHLLWICLAY